MKQRIDGVEGRALYGRRFATVEPVFADLRHNKQLNRFTLRGQTKVDGQWKLFALVHNIEKLASRLREVSAQSEATRLCSPEEPLHTRNAPCLR